MTVIELQEAIENALASQDVGEHEVVIVFGAHQYLLGVCDEQDPTMVLVALGTVEDIS